MTLLKCTALMFILLAVTKCGETKDILEEQTNNASADESDVGELSPAEINAAAQSQSDVKFIELLEDRKRKEMEDRAKARISQEADSDRGSDEYFAAMRERNSWLFEHKSRLVHVALLLLALSVVALIYYKMYAVKRYVEEQNAQVKKYAQQIENMTNAEVAVKHVTWKDQKEGILFCDNPAYARKVPLDLPAAEIIQRDLDRLSAELLKQGVEMEALRRKEDAYIEEIERLRQEYEQKKKEVLEEGAVLADGDGVMREYN